MTIQIRKRALSLIIMTCCTPLCSALAPVPAQAAAPGEARGSTHTAPPAGAPARKPREVDQRLLRKVTLALKGASLTDFCAQIQEQTGVELRASRGVADEKVTVFVKEQPARDLMRAVARLFGYYWIRAGEASARRYEINQDLRSQLVEEELRNRDFHAALLAVDAQMEKIHPYVGSYEQVMKRLDELQTHGQHRAEMQAMAGATYGGWGGIQLYFRLTPGERTMLAAGEDLVFRADDPNPDRRFPNEWQRSILQTYSYTEDVNGQPTPWADVPGLKVEQLRLCLNRSELGQVSLVARPIIMRPDGTRFFMDRELATGRNPSGANPDNGTANAALRTRTPFDQTVSLRPQPSCPAPKNPLRPENLDNRFDCIPDLTEPHVLSADVWEAVHRATGLPIVADFYSRIYPARKVTPSERSLFEALCSVSDVLGARWTKEGDYLMCRSSSYFWDKLKEVPNRFLQRWTKDREAPGGLPLADFLEMATLSDQQLSSSIVAEVIEQYWRLREWQHLGAADGRRRARFVATLSPEQLQRAMQRAGLPFQELTPAQQAGAFQYQQGAGREAERQGAAPFPLPEAWWHGTLAIDYVPGGCYAWVRPQSYTSGPAPARPVAGRSAEEALAAIRKIYPPASSQDVKLTRGGFFVVGVWY